MAVIQQVTLEDVAKACGLSKATVTQILSGKSKYKFREETKQKVIETAEKLNYRPNLFATALRKQENKMILCIVGDALRYSDSMLLKHLEREFGSRGYNLLIQFLIDLPDAQKIEFIRNFLYFPAGILINSLGFASAESYDILRPMLKTAPPVLLLSKLFKDCHDCADFIKINWGEESHWLMFKFFRERSCRNIAYCIDGNDDDDNRPLSQNFLRASKQAGFNARIYASPRSGQKYDYYSAGKDIAGQIAADADFADGIRVYSDEMFFAIEEHLRRQYNIDMTKKYHVISGGDSEFSRKYVNPPHILVHDWQKQAQMAAQYMISRLESDVPFPTGQCIGTLDQQLITPEQ